MYNKVNTILSSVFWWETFASEGKLVFYDNILAMMVGNILKTCVRMDEFQIN